MAFLISFILCALFLRFSSAVDYCTYSSQHTMCKYTGKGCTALASGVTTDQITEILRVHNQLRAKVANGQQSGQPAAGDMSVLTWDAEIATIAQRWVDQCTFAHDTDRRSSVYSYVGQNLAWTGSTDGSNKQANFTQATKMWFDEVTNPGFTEAEIDPFRPKNNAGTGHYTQVAWAQSKKIGCGYTMYKKADSSYYEKLYACNYGPGGNYLETPMYKKAAACSKCTGKCSTTYPGLCE